MSATKTDLRRSAFTMSITPFDTAGRLDETALRLHLRRLRDAGVSVYVGGSVVGEAFALPSDELDTLLTVSVEELGGTVPLRGMGMEPHNFEQVMDFVRRAERHGLDAVHVFAPEMGHGAKPTPTELEAYYTRVIGDASIPVVLSSYQSMGIILPVDMVERLAERFDTLIGIFYGGTDMVYLAELIRRLGAQMEVYCAGPSNALTTLGLGGNGFMAHEGNLSPALFTDLIAAFESGDRAKVAATHSKMMQIHGLHRPYGAAASRLMKPLLNRLGLPGGTVRPPRMPVTGDELERALRTVLDMDLPGLPGRAAEV